MTRKFILFFIITLNLFINTQAEITSIYYDAPGCERLQKEIETKTFEHSQIFIDNFDNKEINFLSTTLTNNSCLRIKNSNMDFLFLNTINLNKSSMIIIDNVKCAYIIWPNPENVGSCCVIILKDVIVDKTRKSKIYKGAGLIKKLEKEKQKLVQKVEEFEITGNYGDTITVDENGIKATEILHRFDAKSVKSVMFNDFSTTTNINIKDYFGSISFENSKLNKGRLRGKQLKIEHSVLETFIFDGTTFSDKYDLVFNNSVIMELGFRDTKVNKIIFENNVKIKKLVVDSEAIEFETEKLIPKGTFTIESLKEYLLGLK